MRIMASVWLSVLVLIAVQEAFGNVCDKEKDELSCDECIRCGGSWCTERGDDHCAFSIEDGWCPDHKEKLVSFAPVNKAGDLITPIYVKRTLFINVPDTIDINFTAKVKGETKIVLVNTTQSSNINIVQTTKCSNDMNCTMSIEAEPKADFCSSTGTTEEFVQVKVVVGGLDDTILLDYHVPCACKCSKTVVKNDPSCSGNGDLSCGVCTCHNGWRGHTCSIPPRYECTSNQPEHRRGDLQCFSPYSDLECSGNGYCGKNDNCICYDDREGSQYYDQENACADLCMVISDCEYCLANNTIGLCEGCCIGANKMYMQNYTAGQTNETDQLDRPVWVNCNLTVDECLIRYVAKMDEEGDIVVMVEENCNNVISEHITGTVTPKVPIILAIVGILGAVAAVAGVMIWKHMNAIPPAPLNNTSYENIDAEDCTGENPLYKPPTSSFKNPMYGNKW